ncbi:RNA 2'-phosphotransferase [Kordiimonas sp.]|uniref:RNA 2'-phosphotransferase n=1 Tax=Kordiimonas sp. TaxID=1970157 RepID=UPI003A91857A
MRAPSVFLRTCGTSGNLFGIGTARSRINVNTNPGDTAIRFFNLLTSTETATQVRPARPKQRKMSRDSRYISRVLRHQPELIDIRLDPQGWVEVDELLRNL